MHALIEHRVEIGWSCHLLFILPYVFGCGRVILGCNYLISIFLVVQQTQNKKHISSNNSRNTIKHRASNPLPPARASARLQLRVGLDCSHVHQYWQPRHSYCRSAPDHPAALIPGRYRPCTRGWRSIPCGTARGPVCASSEHLLAGTEQVWYIHNKDSCTGSRQVSSKHTH